MKFMHAMIPIADELCRSVFTNTVNKSTAVMILGYIAHFFPTEAIHQRILLYYISVVARSITKLLYSKV